MENYTDAGGELRGLGEQRDSKRDLTNCKFEYIPKPQTHQHRVEALWLRCLCSTSTKIIDPGETTKKPG